MEKMVTEQEQQELQKQYYGHIVEFREEIKRVKGWKRALITQLAADLEQSGTIPTNKICGKIIRDLKPEIDEEEISAGYIWDVLDDKFKESAYAKLGKKGGTSSTSRWTRWAKKRGNLAKKLTEVVKQWSDTDIKRARTMPPSQLARETRDYCQRMILTWDDDRVYVTEELLNIVVPLLQDRQGLVREEARGRRKKAKILTK